MTFEDAMIVVSDHIRWLDKNDRKTIADAILEVVYHTGMEAALRKLEAPGGIDGLPKML